MRRWALPGVVVVVGGTVAAVLAGTSQVKAAPALTITVSPSANPIGQGQSLNYAVKVTNGSGSMVSNLAITDSLSGVAGSGGGGAYALTRSAGSCSQAASRVECSSASLAAGQSLTITVAGTVTAPAGSTVRNVASVSGASSGQTVIAGTTNATTVQLPQGFTQTQLLSGLKHPSVLAFAPNGDMWIGMQGGPIYIYHNGHLNSAPVVTLPADGHSELGVLGIAFDPNFSSNGFFYVSYTTTADNTQLSRLTFNGSTAPLSSEKVLIRGEEVQTSYGFGPGETLKLGPDGKLWWSVGGNPYPWGNAQTLQNVYGKVHRLNLDGSAASDNPFVNVPHADPSIYAYGLRNPFRFTFLPNGGVMLSDTGSSYWEELNNIQKGSNYGWPITEGDSFTSGYANPVYSYGHLPNDGAESAILAYQQPSSGQVFPSQYNNVVFFGDYNRKDIEAVTFDPSYQTPTSDYVFSANAGTISDLEEGPDGNVYFTSIYDGTVSKISANQAQFPPTAAASFTQSIPGGPLVQFSSTGSSDSYGHALSYNWDFGDGQTSTSSNPQHTYAPSTKACSCYVATLTVSNGSQSAKATTTVMIGRTTTASITLPSNYNAGQSVAFSGSASDSIDGTLPASAYTWQVDFISNGVVEPYWLHENPLPFFGPKSGITGGSFAVPNDVSQIPNSFYRVTLTVVNSAGVATVVTKDIHPNTTSWTASASVAGAPFYVDGVWQNATYTATDVVGVQHVLMGQAEQTIGGQNYRFLGWSANNGTPGGFSQSFTSSSASGATYTAQYDPVGPLPSGWQNADIGGSLPGGAEYSSATGTLYVDGSGTDASSSTDQFHYTYETLNGDGTIVARVRYQTNTNPWAKAGVMIKQSATSGAAFVDALVTPDVSGNTPNLNGINCVFPSDAPGAGCDAPLPAVTPAIGHGVGIQSKNGGPTMNTSSSALAGYSSPNKWLKLTRSGSKFTAYFSIDGSNWQSLGTTSLSMSGPVTIGLFVSSHDNRMLESVGFDNVSVTGGSGGGGNDFSISANPNTVTVAPGSGTSTSINTAVTSGSAQSVVLSASGLPSGAGASFNPTSVTAGNSSTMSITTMSSTPTGSYTVTVTGTGTSATHSTTVTLNVQSAGGGSCPNGWTCADIGSTSPAGTQSFDSGSGTWTLQGSGSDIQGSSDSFRYIWQTLAGNGSISAHVTAQQNTNAWAKTGVMFRGSNAANSANYAVFVTPGNGIVVSYRSSTGGSTTVMHSIAHTSSNNLPVYLMVTRSGTGTTFSASTSSDGVNWTTISGSTVTIGAMSGTVLYGLADTSHANGTLCSVTMDSVIPT